MVNPFSMCGDPREFDMRDEVDRWCDAMDAKFKAEHAAAYQLALHAYNAGVNPTKPETWHTLPQLREMARPDGLQGVAA